MPSIDPMAPETAQGITTTSQGSTSGTHTLPTSRGLEEEGRFTASSEAQASHGGSRVESNGELLDIERSTKPDISLNLIASHDGPDAYHNEGDGWSNPDETLDPRYALEEAVEARVMPQVKVHSLSLKKGNSFSKQSLKVPEAELQATRLRLFPEDRHYTADQRLKKLEKVFLAREAEYQRKIDNFSTNLQEGKIRSDWIAKSLCRTTVDVIVARAIATCMLEDYRAMEKHAFNAIKSTQLLAWASVYASLEKRCHYLLGVALFYQQRFEDAHGTFVKAGDCPAAAGVSLRDAEEWRHVTQRAISQIFVTDAFRLESRLASFSQGPFGSNKASLATEADAMNNVSGLVDQSAHTEPSSTQAAQLVSPAPSNLRSGALALPRTGDGTEEKEDEARQKSPTGLMLANKANNERVPRNKTYERLVKHGILASNLSNIPERVVASQADGNSISTPGTRRRGLTLSDLKTSVPTPNFGFRATRSSQLQPIEPIKKPTGGRPTLSRDAITRSYPTSAGASMQATEMPAAFGGGSEFDSHSSTSVAPQSSRVTWEDGYKKGDDNVTNSLRVQSSAGASRPLLARISTHPPSASAIVLARAAMQGSASMRSNTPYAPSPDTSIQSGASMEIRAAFGGGGKYESYDNTPVDSQRSTWVDEYMREEDVIPDDEREKRWEAWEKMRRDEDELWKIDEKRFKAGMSSNIKALKKEEIIKRKKKEKQFKKDKPEVDETEAWKTSMVDENDFSPTIVRKLRTND